MADTYNFTNGSITDVPVVTQTTLNANEPMILRQLVDLTKQNLAHGATDIAQCLIVPEGTTVLTAWIRTITAGSASATCTLGTTENSQPAVWGTALDLNSATGTTLGALFDPVYFDAAGTVDITAGGATDTTGKYEVCALCIKSLNTY